MVTGLTDLSWDKRSMLSGPDMFVRTESESQVGLDLKAQWQAERQAIWPTLSKPSAHRQT